MEDIYRNGRYLKQHSDWHLEDSPWKAGHIFRLLEKHRLSCRRVAEIGSGAGGILAVLCTLLGSDVQFHGYDISPQAVAMAKRIRRPNLSFHQGDPFTEQPTESFDLLLLIDVLEHLQDPVAFLEKCRGRATYTICHSPLDISVVSVLRNTYVESRHTLGHLHHYTFASALAMLEDTGYRILDAVYTDVGTYYYRKYPSIRNFLRNLPRWVTAVVDKATAARIFGRYSVLVLAQ